MMMRMPRAWSVLAKTIAWPVVLVGLIRIHEFHTLLAVTKGASKEASHG